MFERIRFTEQYLFCNDSNQLRVWYVYVFPENDSCTLQYELMFLFSEFAVPVLEVLCSGRRRQALEHARHFFVDG